MVRLDKLTDYGLLLLTCVARSQGNRLRTARDLAAETALPLPTVSRLLQELLKGGLLLSHRGIKGGYELARDPHEISVAGVIATLEGPIALTQCSAGAEACGYEPRCAIKRNQQVINDAVRNVLERLTLADLMQPLRLMTIKDAGGRFVSRIDVASGSIQ